MSLMTELTNVVNTLHAIENEPSRIRKEDALESHVSNDILQKVLEYAYNPYKVYGVGKKTVDGYESLETTMTQSKYSNIFELLDFLSESNINNEIRADIMDFLSSNPPHLRRLYVNMILKDLRLGMGAKSINKVFDDLIPVFNLMLAKSLKDRADKIVGEQIVISLKLDGIRMAIIKEDDNIKFMTRQGKRLEGLIDIEREVRKLPNGVYDGELLKVNADNLNSKELFQLTRKETGKKGTKEDLVFHVFDYIPTSEFQNGESELDCLDRKGFVSDALSNLDLKWIAEVEILEVTNDHSRIKYWLDRAIEAGEEGVMLNLQGAYECKRSNNLLKVKEFHTVDLEIIGFIEGEGRLNGTLGRLTVDYKGYECGIGSGFTDVEREEIWSNRDKYLGRVVEVNYFEETKNENGGLSLRFPTFSYIRNEGKEVSYN